MASVTRIGPVAHEAEFLVTAGLVYLEGVSASKGGAMKLEDLGESTSARGGVPLAWLRCGSNSQLTVWELNSLWLCALARAPPTSPRAARAVRLVVVAIVVVVPET